MTTQEAYETIREYFSQPDSQYGAEPIELPEPIGLDFLCKYRTFDGRKCAIGCLIRDEDYLPEFDDPPASVRELMYKYQVLSSDIDEYFLHDVRELHDNYAVEGCPISSFLDRLDELAQRYGLIVSE